MCICLNTPYYTNIYYYYYYNFATLLCNMGTYVSHIGNFLNNFHSTMNVSQNVYREHVERSVEQKNKERLRKIKIFLYPIYKK